MNDTTRALGIVDKKIFQGGRYTRSIVTLSLDKFLTDYIVPSQDVSSCALDKAWVEDAEGKIQGRELGSSIGQVIMVPGFRSA